MTEKQDDLPEITLKSAVELQNSLPSETDPIPETPVMQPVAQPKEQVVNYAVAQHYHVDVDHDQLLAFKTGYQTHYVFDEPQLKIRTGDVIKFQKTGTPDYQTFKVGAFHHIEYSIDDAPSIVHCTVVTLLPHKEKGFAQPFQQTGDRYRQAFFQRTR